MFQTAYSPELPLHPDSVLPCLAVQQGRPITVPGVEAHAEGTTEDPLTTAETAPTDHNLPAMQSPGGNIELAASAPATEMPSIERVWELPLTTTKSQTSSMQGAFRKIHNISSWSEKV